MTLILITISLLLELLLFTAWLWPVRRPLAGIIITIITIGTTICALGKVSSWIVLLSILSITRIFNVLRIYANRRDEQHLYIAIRRSSVALIAIQAIIITFAFLDTPTPGPATTATILGFAQCAVAIGLFLVTERNILKSQFRPDEVHYADRDLPSISLCVPARNETHHLEEFLHSALASDYPKLEIIVLDDSSHDTTPQIIRKFAHDGVRFVAGSEPDSHWLAKNLAYERLNNEASGEYILYCGVDVRFKPESLRRLVSAMLTRKKQMISVMPVRYTDSLAGAFVQPMRYWWELALPRRLFDRPPVLSTCWLISKSSLKKLGGFAAVSRTIIPESYFAQKLVKQDAYSFLRSDTYLGIQTEKPVRAQQATTILVRYPQIHKRLEIALGLAIAEVVLLIAPFIVLTYSLVTGRVVITLATTIAVMFLVATHARIVSVSSPPSTAIALVNFPIAVLMELGLSLLSMARYEFSTVIWKSRVISPSKQLEVISNLPQLK